MSTLNTIAPSICTPVDTEFLITLERGGVNFMMQAAKARIGIFDGFVADGWALKLRGTWMEQSFLCRLSEVKDVDLAVHVLKSVLAGASTEQVNAALLNKTGTDEPAVRSWLYKWNNVDKAWRDKVIGAALELGLDFKTEFSYAAQCVPSSKHTLLSSLVVDLYRDKKHGSIMNSTTNDWAPSLIEPIHEVLAFQRQPDKLSIAAALKHFDMRESELVLAMFEKHGDLNATDALASIARLKILPEKLASLQAKSALEAIDEVISSQKKCIPR